MQLELLKKARIEAMRNKDTLTKGILDVILLDASNSAKAKNVEVADEHIIASASGWRKKLRDALEKSKDPNLEKEIAIVSAYLPTEMSEDESVAATIAYLDAQPQESLVQKNMGTFIRAISEKHPGINKASVSKAIKSKLN